MNRIHLFLEEKIIIEIKVKSLTQNYQLSNLITAHDFIKAILEYLEISDHVEKREDKMTFSKLYLEKNYLPIVAIKSICERLFLHEKSLYRYRLKYIKIISFLLEKYRVNFITDKFCP